MNRGKILAVDFGTARIGIAVSDEERTVAFPRDWILSVPRKKALEKLSNLTCDEQIAVVVFGLPLDMENHETLLCAQIRKFAAALHSISHVAIDFIDESNSSRQSIGKIPFKKDRKKEGYVDMIAAQQILVRWLMK